jgi:hypothetical protein
LLDGIQLDDVGDLETLLMILLDRPITVREVASEAGAPNALEVIVHGDPYSTGTVHEFPVSVTDLVRASAETAREMGSNAPDSGEPESTTLADMDDLELTGALQRALGRVRVYNLMYDDDAVQDGPVESGRPHQHPRADEG